MAHGNFTETINQTLSITPTASTEVWFRRRTLAFCESPGGSRPARTLGQSGHQSTGRSWRYPSSVVWHHDWNMGKVMIQHDRISSKYCRNDQTENLRVPPFTPVFRQIQLPMMSIDWNLWTNGSFPLSDEINGGYPYFQKSQIPKVFLGKTCLIKDTGRWISQFWNHAKVGTWAQSIGNTDDVWSSNRWTKPWDWDNPCEWKKWWWIKTKTY